MATFSSLAARPARLTTTLSLLTLLLLMGLSGALPEMAPEEPEALSPPPSGPLIDQGGNDPPSVRTDPTGMLMPWFEHDAFVAANPQTPVEHDLLVEGPTGFATAILEWPFAFDFLGMPYEAGDAVLLSDDGYLRFDSTFTTSSTQLPSSSRTFIWFHRDAGSYIANLTTTVVAPGTPDARWIIQVDIQQWPVEDNESTTVQIEFQSRTNRIILRHHAGDLVADGATPGDAPRVALNAESGLVYLDLGEVNETWTMMHHVIDTLPFGRPGTDVGLLPFTPLMAPVPVIHEVPIEVANFGEVAITPTIDCTLTPEMGGSPIPFAPPLPLIPPDEIVLVPLSFPGASEGPHDVSCSLTASGDGTTSDDLIAFDLDIRNLPDARATRRDTLFLDFSTGSNDADSFFGSGAQVGADWFRHFPNSQEPFPDLDSLDYGRVHQVWIRHMIDKEVFTRDTIPAMLPSREQMEEDLQDASSSDPWFTAILYAPFSPPSWFNETFVLALTLTHLSLVLIGPGWFNGPWTFGTAAQAAWEQLMAIMGVSPTDEHVSASSATLVPNMQDHVGHEMPTLNDVDVSGSPCLEPSDEDPATALLTLDASPEETCQSQPVATWKTRYDKALVSMPLSGLGDAIAMDVFTRRLGALFSGDPVEVANRPVSLLTVLENIGNVDVAPEAAELQVEGLSVGLGFDSVPPTTVTDSITGDLALGESRIQRITANARSDFIWSAPEPGLYRFTYRSVLANDTNRSNDASWHDVLFIETENLAIELIGPRNDTISPGQHTASARVTNLGSSISNATNVTLTAQRYSWQTLASWDFEDGTTQGWTPLAPAVMQRNATFGANDTDSYQLPLTGPNGWGNTWIDLTAVDNGSTELCWEHIAILPGTSMSMSFSSNQSWTTAGPFAPTDHAAWNDSSADPGDWRTVCVDLTNHHGGNVSWNLNLAQRTGPNTIEPGYFLDTLRVTNNMSGVLLMDDGDTDRFPLFENEWGVTPADGSDLGRLGNHALRSRGSNGQVNNCAISPVLMLTGVLAATLALTLVMPPGLENSSYWWMALAFWFMGAGISESTDLFSFDDWYLEELLVLSHLLFGSWQAILLAPGLIRLTMPLVLGLAFAMRLCMYGSEFGGNGFAVDDVTVRGLAPDGDAQGGTTTVPPLLPGEDRIISTPFDAESGDELIIRGHRGDDRLFGGGSDDILGGGSDDIIRGDPHDDDLIRDLGGGDDLLGDGGQDRLFGHPEQDILRGGVGDQLVGECAPGHDLLPPACGVLPGNDLFARDAARQAFLDHDFPLPDAPLDDLDIQHVYTETDEWDDPAEWPGTSELPPLVEVTEEVPVNLELLYQLGRKGLLTNLSVEQLEQWLQKGTVVQAWTHQQVDVTTPSGGRSTLTLGAPSMWWTPTMLGVHTLHYRIYMANGTVHTVNTSIEVVDGSPPVVTITAPSSSAVGAALSASATATDGSGVDASTWQWEVYSGVLLLDSGTGDSLSYSPLTDGILTIVFRVQDNDGLEGRALAEVSVGTGSGGGPADVLGPDVGTTGNRSVALGETISVTLSGTDPAGVDATSWSWTIARGLRVVASGTGATVEYTPTQSGEHTLVVSVRDTLGNPSTRAITLEATDSVAPSVQAPRAFNGPDGELLIQVTVVDLDAVSVSVTIIGDDNESLTRTMDRVSGRTDRFELVVPKDERPAGALSLLVTATDASGNEGQWPETGEAASLGVESLGEAASDNTVLAVSGILAGTGGGAAGLFWLARNRRKDEKSEMWREAEQDVARAKAKVDMTDAAFDDDEDDLLADED